MSNRKHPWLLILLASGATGASAQTTMDLRTQARNVDFSAAASTRPTKTGTELPAACAPGEEFFKTDAVPGQNKYGCTAQDTWMPMGSSAIMPGQLGNDFATASNTTVLTTLPGTRVFGATKMSTGGCTYTISAGNLSGMAYEYFTDSGQVVLEYAAGPGTLSVTKAGTDCQTSAVTTPGWPTGLNFHPIATVEVIDGQWGRVTQHPSLSAGWYAVCGMNLECTYSKGTVAIEAGANVMTLGGDNRVTGALNLADAQSFTVPVAGADPAVCVPGQQYFNSTGQKARVCIGANNWSDLAGGSGAAGGVAGSNLTSGHVIVGAGGASVADSGKAAPAGALVGDSDAQVLSNKTLQGPVFTGPAGGTLDLRQASVFLLPTAGADPAGCAPGQHYFNTSGLHARVCTASNTWADMGGSGNVAGSGLTAGVLVQGSGGAAVGTTGIPVGAVARTDQGNTYTAGLQDFSAASGFRLPNAAGDPAGCSPGQKYFNTATGRERICTAANSWSDAGGGGGASLSRILLAGTAAKCQMAVAGAGFSLPEANAPAATCDQGEANPTQAYLKFAAGSPQSIYDRFELPGDWSGTLRLAITGWSASTEAPAIHAYLACAGTGATSNPAYGSAQAVLLTPAGSSGRTRATRDLDTGGCAAGFSAFLKITITAGSAPLNLMAAQVTE